MYISFNVFNLTLTMLRFLNGFAWAHHHGTARLKGAKNGGVEARRSAKWVGNDIAVFR